MVKISHPEGSYSIEFQPRAFSPEQCLAFERRLQTLEARGEELPQRSEGAGALTSAKRELLTEYAKLFDDMLGVVMADARLPAHSPEISRGTATRNLYLFGLTPTYMHQKWYDVLKGGRYLRSAESILSTVQEAGDAVTLELFARALRQPLEVERDLSVSESGMQGKYGARRKALAPLIAGAIDRIDLRGSIGQDGDGELSSPVLRAVTALDRVLKESGYGDGFAGIAPHVMQARQKEPQKEDVARWVQNPSEIVQVLQQLLYPLPICQIRGADGNSVTLPPAHAQQVLQATEELCAVLKDTADLNRMQQEVIDNALRSTKGLLGRSTAQVPPLLVALSGLDTSLRKAGYDKGLHGVAPTLVHTRRGALRPADMEQWSQDRTQNVRVMRALLGDLVLRKISDDDGGTMRISAENARNVLEAVATLAERMNDEHPFHRMHREALMGAIRNANEGIGR